MRNAATVEVSRGSLNALRMLISGKALRIALSLLFLHMACTFTPLLFFPAKSFKFPPYGFTLVGQYIMKNIVIISAALVIFRSLPKPARAKEQLQAQSLSRQ